MPFKYADVDELYKKNPNLKKADVESLLEWAKKQQHLPQLSELDALIFLQSCCYSNETAKNAIDNYYTMRTTYPECFLNRNPSDPAFQRTLDMSIDVVLPSLTPEGDAIIVGRLIDTRPELYDIDWQTRVFDMVVSAHQHANGPFKGVHFVMDMEGSSLGHLTRVSLSQLRMMINWVQEAIPMRLVAVHYVNIASFIDKLLMLIKPFMKKELLDLLHIHSKMATLHDLIPVDCLPKEYGGTLPFTLMEYHEKSRKFLLDSQDFFAVEEKQVVDESKRLEKSKNGSAFGAEGTFKKLQLD